MTFTSKSKVPVGLVQIAIIAVCVVDVVAFMTNIGRDGAKKNYEIRGISNTLISSYLKNREQFVCSNSEFSTFKSIELSVLQGSN